MDDRESPEPRLRAAFYTWSFRAGHTQVLFLGRGPLPERDRAFQKVVNQRQLQLSWTHQVHSTTVAEVRVAGLCGEADALTTLRTNIALSVATADCLPIVIAGRQRLATIHAGWRGLAGQIIRRTLESFGEDERPLEVWIGPAIGACCYEVGDEVAHRVVAVSGPHVLIDRQPKVHLDLTAAAESQLERCGVQRIHSLSVCTRCSPDWLWSYRRDKNDAGRNWTFAWRNQGSEG